MPKPENCGIEEWLRFQKFCGQLKTPEARDTADKYPGVTCYRDLFGAHLWVQVYKDDGCVWVIHGSDSTLPGLDVDNHDPSDMTICDCGRWTTASKEQTENSRRIAATVFRESMRGRN